MTPWNYNKIGHWVIRAGCKIEKGLELSPSTPKCSRVLKIIALAYICQLAKFDDLMRELLFKRYIQKCTVLRTNTHPDVTDLINHGMVKNTRTYISWEPNITFQRNKKILNLCLRWYILRSYRFAFYHAFSSMLETGSYCKKHFHHFKGLLLKQTKQFTSLVISIRLLKSALKIRFLKLKFDIFEPILPFLIKYYVRKHYEMYGMVCIVYYDRLHFNLFVIRFKHRDFIFYTDK